MNVEEFRLYCIKKPGVTEEFPFDQSTLVFKVMGKMFSLTGLDNPNFSVNLKCDPEYADELREKHTCIVPGYHMSKKHWNTIYLDQGELTDQFTKELIDHSYDLVVSKFSKILKESLKNLS